MFPGVNVQKKKTGKKWKFLVYSLLLIIPSAFSFDSFHLSSTIKISFFQYSVQQANAGTTTPEGVFLGDLSTPAIYEQSPTIPAATLTNNLLTYQNPTYGITLQYPSSWEKIEYPRLGLAVVGNDLVANLLAPLANASDHWREHFMIQVLNQTQAKKLIPQSDTILGGRHGYKRVYDSTMEILNLDTNTEQRLHLKTMEVWVSIGNGNTCLMKYKAVAARYSDYLPTIQKMFSSFKIDSSSASHNSTTY
jgi:hypothetical protein